MAFLRGWIYRPAQERPTTSGLVVLTNDRWNQTMLRVGVVPVRTAVAPFDIPYSVALPGGTHVVASRLVAPHVEGGLLGLVEGALDATTLAAVEDRLCAFLQIPELLRPAPRPAPPLGDATRYAAWSEVHRAGPEVDGERKRRIVVSPNPWNAVSGMATFVRTTTSFAGHGDEFPQVQGGAGHACCGDATTFELRAVLLQRRDRPVPHSTTLHDMVAIARGLAVTHGLEEAVRRAGTSLH